MTRETTLFYFTGTGNSLACARALAAQLGETRLVPLAALRNLPRVPVETPQMGIVCPVYFYTLPLLVREFIPKLDLSHVGYSFLVVTMGGFPGLALVHGQELFQQAGGRLHAGFAIRMYPNYIAAYDPRKWGSVRGMERRLKRAVPAIVQAVRAEKPKPVHASVLGRAMFALLGRTFLQNGRIRDRMFYADDRCTSCGTCAAICPVEDIELMDGKPRWQGHCEQCLACLHFCPTEAIQIRGQPTERRGRYHHPQVTVADIAAQRRFPPT